MILLNLKAYEEFIGNKAVKLAMVAEKVAKQTGVKIIVIPGLLELERVARAVKIDVYAQHVDERDYGKNTGSILIESAKQAGAKGAIINHSENRIPMEKIKRTVEKAKKLKFTIVVCVNNMEEAKEVDKFEPDYIAYEVPELIGGNISVATAEPEIIRKIVKSVKTKVLVGAGVGKKQDVKRSIELGAKGVLLASELVKTEDVEATIRDLAEGMK